MESENEGGHELQSGPKVLILISFPVPVIDIKINTIEPDWIESIPISTINEALGLSRWAQM
jgi:hypothetical protein